MPESKTGVEYYGPEEMDRLELERLSPGGPREIGPGMTLRMSYPEALKEVAKDKVEEFMNELRGTTMLPGDVYSGKVDVTTAEGIDQAVRMGFNVATSGIMSGAAVPDKGTVGMFIGPKARNWNDKAADEASFAYHDLLKKPDDYERWAAENQNWAKTGTMRSPSGDYWQEISDELMKIKLPHDKQWEAKLGDLVDHPELFANYPDLKNIKIRNTAGVKDPDPELASYAGWWDRNKNEIVLQHLYSNDEQFKKLLLHEMQHVVQTEEGIRSQGGPSNANNELNRAMRRMDPITFDELDQKVEPVRKDKNFQNELYSNYENEQLAELTANRHNMPMNDRALTDEEAGQIARRGMFLEYYKDPTRYEPEEFNRAWKSPGEYLDLRSIQREHEAKGRLNESERPIFNNALPHNSWETEQAKQAIEKAIDWHDWKTRKGYYSQGGEVVNRGGIESLLQYSKKTGKPIRKFGYGGDVDGGSNEYTGAVGTSSDNYGNFNDAMGPTTSGGFSFEGWSGSNNPGTNYGGNGGSIGLGDTSGGSFGVGGGEGVIGGSDPIGGGSWGSSYGEGSSGIGGMTGNEALGVTAQGNTTSGDVFTGTDGHEFIGTSPITDTIPSNVDRALGPVGPASFGLNSLTGAVQSPMAQPMENPLGTINPTANPIGIPDLIDPNTFGYQQMEYSKSAVNTPSISLTDRDIRDLAAINRAEAGIIAQGFINQGYPPDVARQMAFAHVTDTVMNRSMLSGMSIRDVIQQDKQFSPLNGGRSISSLPASPEYIAATKSYLGTASTWGMQNPQATSFANTKTATDRSWLGSATVLGNVGVPGQPSHQVSTGVPGQYGGIVPDYNINLPASTPRVDTPVEMATRSNPNINVASIPTPPERPYETFDTNRTYAGRELESAPVQTADNTPQPSAPEITANGEKLGVGMPGLSYTEFTQYSPPFETPQTPSYSPSVQTVENTEQIPSDMPAQPSPSQAPTQAMTQTASIDPFGFSKIDLGWTSNPTSMDKANQLTSQTGYRSDWQQFASPLDAALGIAAPGWNAVSPQTQVANIPTPPERPPEFTQPAPAPAPAPAQLVPSAPPSSPPQVIPASVQTPAPPAPNPVEEQKKSLTQQYGPTVAGAIATVALPFPVNAVIGLPSLFGGPNIVKDFTEHILSGNAVFQPGTPNLSTNSSASSVPVTNSQTQAPAQTTAPVQETPAPETTTPRNDLIATLFDIDKFIGPHAYNGYSPRPI